MKFFSALKTNPVFLHFSLMGSTGWRRNKDSKEEGFIIYFSKRGNIVRFCFISLKNHNPFHWHGLQAKTWFNEFHAHAQYFGKLRSVVCKRKEWSWMALPHDTQLEFLQMVCFHHPQKASFESNRSLSRFFRCLENALEVWLSFMWRSN